MAVCARWKLSLRIRLTVSLKRWTANPIMQFEKLLTKKFALGGI
jgi:hypothetical protein